LRVRSRQRRQQQRRRKQIVEEGFGVRSHVNVALTYLDGSAGGGAWVFAIAGSVTFTPARAERLISMRSPARCRS
jgi:hypothetical protein